LNHSPIIYDEKGLLLRLSEGDEMAFKAIYDRYRKKIASFAFLLTESADMTDEILQEVFVKLWINRSKLPDVIHFNAWLHTIARNLVVDAMKKIAREKAVRTIWTDRTPLQDNYADEIIFARENEKLLHQAIQQLTPQQQEVYKLSREQGLKHEEIASRLNISAMTVKNHLVNAMRTIREYFRGHADLIMIVVLLGQHH
jgi:RNA polymerase sigma-70 factor (family 1)